MRQSVEALEEPRGPPELMLWPEVIRETTLSKAVIQRRMKAGDFPVPLQLSPNRVAWLRSEVAHWRSNRDRAPLAA